MLNKVQFNFKVAGLDTGSWNELKLILIVRVGVLNAIGTSTELRAYL